MIFWSIAIAVTAIACAALFYAGAGRAVNAAGPESSDANSHFRQLLAAIEADLASGKLDARQADAAKGELARELLRVRREATPGAAKTELGRGMIAVGVLGAGLAALGLYAVLGRPDLPSLPLSERPELVAQTMNLADAIAQIEARLAEVPDDLRGWTVVAPAYIEMGRYADAANAYRRVIALSGPTAELQTDLAEALLLDGAEGGRDEAMSLLRAAATAEPDHIRSRLYLAAELMRIEDYAEASRFWREAIALSDGSEAWLSAAQQGLNVAQSGGVDAAAAQQAEMIANMVASLSSRLESEGGSVEEWTQLVRSYLVLGEHAQAQVAYDAAVTAYPAAFDRGELDTLALAAGLTLNGARP